jgi:hypothetical protein
MTEPLTTQMTLELARKQNLDVYMFPHYRQDLQARTADVLRNFGRVVTEFEAEIAGFKLLCVAASQRAGEVAPVLKERRKKTVREFIQEQ